MLTSEYKEIKAIETVSLELVAEVEQKYPNLDGFV